MASISLLDLSCALCDRSFFPLSEDWKEFPMFASCGHSVHKQCFERCASFPCPKEHDDGDAKKQEMNIGPNAFYRFGCVQTWIAHREAFSKENPDFICSQETAIKLNELITTFLNTHDSCRLHQPWSLPAKY